MGKDLEMAKGSNEITVLRLFLPFSVKRYTQNRILCTLLGDQKAHPVQLPEAGNPCAGDQFIPYANEVERQKATDEKCQRRLGLIVTTPIAPPLCDPRSL
ncbi:hypothetical protein CDAR_257851 [Caerostris darwini]|uniref:Uncharacterized protein n=1 Tax=Caerostris darwini TaxID=1538125 RepID=A0AAV4WVS2_9ARAC|nr:hypothetical protein CDAR_257851 [Caerostris darwini]